MYVAALVLGNADLPHRTATRSFAEGLAWLAQIGLFVMLGLLLSPGRGSTSRSSDTRSGRADPDVRGPAAVGAGELGRATDAVAGLGFLSWAGLRGAVPSCSTIPSCRGRHRLDRAVRPGVRDGRHLHPADRPDLPTAARLLKVARRSEPRGLEVEAAPWNGRRRPAPGDDQPGSKMHGVEVGELRLPVGASVSMVVRDHETLRPERRTVLRHGDDLLVVTPAAALGGPRSGCARSAPTGAWPSGSAAAPRVRAEPAGGVLVELSTGGLQISTSSWATTPAGPCPSAW